MSKVYTHGVLTREHAFYCIMVFQLLKRFINFSSFFKKINCFQLVM